MKFLLLALILFISCTSKPKKNEIIDLQRQTHDSIVKYTDDIAQMEEEIKLYAGPLMMNNDGTVDSTNYKFFLSYDTLKNEAEDKLKAFTKKADSLEFELKKYQ